MQRNSLGLCPPLLMSQRGILADVPFLIPEQGVIVHAKWADVTLAVLPISGSEDPRFGPLLTQTGLYRVEDRSGTIARVGQGKLLERIRRHRVAPVVFAWRLVAVIPHNDRWSFEERCYLEARWASYWRSRGHALASTTFMRRFRLDDSQRSSLNQVLEQIIELEAVAKRLFEGDALEEFVPVIGWQGGSIITGHVQHYFAYPPGTILRYRRGGTDATATVRGRLVVLQANSTVCLSAGGSVGSIFRKDHRDFLQGAGTVNLDETHGRTTVDFEFPTAAAAIKRVTGGRVHNANRWQQLAPIDVHHTRI